MVLWEITLGTAYFLGLKRTYRLALRIQRRIVSPKYPQVRQFLHRGQFLTKISFVGKGTHFPGDFPLPPHRPTISLGQLENALDMYPKNIFCIRMSNQQQSTPKYAEQQ
ncbi:hypothetical protein E2542_SST06334 [Spatholobus suberectus]|nr:hypothetical protein E2542_SST06334 [Spatholobus suberectus]